MEATIIHRTVSLPDRPRRLLQPLKKELIVLIVMPLYHVNVPQYDDVLNNKKYLKFHILEVIEFRVISNQSDTNKIKLI